MSQYALWEENCKLRKLAQEAIDMIRKQHERDHGTTPFHVCAYVQCVWVREAERVLGCRK